MGSFKVVEDECRRAIQRERGGTHVTTPSMIFGVHGQRSRTIFDIYSLRYQIHVKKSILPYVDMAF